MAELGILKPVSAGVGTTPDWARQIRRNDLKYRLRTTLPRSQGKSGTISTAEPQEFTHQHVARIGRSDWPSRAGLRIDPRVDEGSASDIGYGIVQRLRTDSIPNLVSVPRTAQAMHAATINDLQKGDLPAALENLAALSGCVRLHGDDPTLVTFTEWRTPN